MNRPLLEVQDLRVRFETELGPANAVDGVSFTIAPGETLALAGESGCGKSVTARAILRLVEPAGRITGGDVRFDGRSVLELDAAALRALRGRAIGMVFQDPVASLNPVLTCGDQIEEVLRVHAVCSRSEARGRAIELLRRVRLPDPERHARAYPHQLSGGMCQRVALALAIACSPRLLIADEPTTALDVTVQAQLVELLMSLQAETGMAILLISHDLGLVAGVADRVAIVYAGRIVESAPVERLFASPRHPCTRGLLRALPALDGTVRVFAPVPGIVPHPAQVPAWCRFHPRCGDRVARCEQEDPLSRAVGPGHEVACFVDPPPKAGAT
jgi:oligopeptide/dipeptide ABC transporter ATP-binding protein